MEVFVSFIILIFKQYNLLTFFVNHFQIFARWALVRLLSRNSEVSSSNLFAA